MEFSSSQSEHINEVSVSTTPSFTPTSNNTYVTSASLATTTTNNVSAATPSLTSSVSSAVGQVPVGPVPVLVSPSAKPPPSIWFTAEIQQMMHGFGDCRKPLLESAHLIEAVVRAELTSALYRVEDSARLRGARFIGIEDFLFLLRRDKVKLRRLIKYMELKDMKKSVLGGRTLEEDVGDTGSESGSHSRRPSSELGDSGSRPSHQPKKRRKICYDFLRAIDQTHELAAIFEDDNYFDEIKHERMLRAELMSRGMDAQQYLDFCAARQASFVARYKSQKFKDWVLQGVSLDIKPNPLAVETLSYLAYETLAQIMDLSLLVRRDMQCDTDPLSKVVPHVQVNYDAFQQHNQMLPPPGAPLHPGSAAASSSGIPGLGQTGMASSAAASLKSPASSMPNSPLNSPPSTPTTPGAVNLNTSTGSTKPPKPSGGGKKAKKAGASGYKDLHSSQAITVAHIREAMRRYGQNIGPFSEFSKSPSGRKHRLLCA